MAEGWFVGCETGNPGCLIAVAATAAATATVAVSVAVVVAVAAARDVIAKQMTAAEGNALIDAAIAEVEAKLH